MHSRSNVAAAQSTLLVTSLECACLSALQNTEPFTTASALAHFFCVLPWMDVDLCSWFCLPSIPAYLISGEDLFTIWKVHEVLHQKYVVLHPILAHWAPTAFPDLQDMLSNSVKIQTWIQDRQSLHLQVSRSATGQALSLRLNLIRWPLI